MDNAIINLFDDLKELLTDYEVIGNETLEVEAEKLIIEKARELIAVVDDDSQTSEPSRPPKKSEMPCNCQPNLKQGDLELMVKSAARSMNTEKRLAAILVVPLDDLLKIF